MNWKHFFGEQMRRMMTFTKSIKEQRVLNKERGAAPNYTALDAPARQALIAHQQQLEAYERGFAVLHDYLTRAVTPEIAAKLHAALELQAPTYGAEPDDEIDPYVVQEPDPKVKKLNEYGNWRWKMDRMAGLFGTQTLARRNVQFRPSPDHNNPDAVFINNIQAQRSYELLTDWARNYFGSINVGGGQRPDDTWWVRIDHGAMKACGLAFPVEPESEDIDPEIVFWQYLVGHSPLPASRWTWPVKFDIEHTVRHQGSDSIRITCEDEGNRYALYNAACSILCVSPGDDSITRTPEGFVIVRNGRQFINAMPVSVRPRIGGLREFEFSHAKQGASK